MADVLGQLAYLHDSEVIEISYVLTDPNSRKVILNLKAHPDTGHQPWDDKPLRVTASGVYLLRCESWGHVLGNEAINAWSQGVSDDTRSQLAVHTSRGLHVPELEFTVTFHSGSFLELVCETVSVEVIKEPEENDNRTEPIQ
ncbi:MAG: hypothetical protein DMF61_16270 [Blastocatellia bacterium AA13]|nr:MAG: hypothetical protein DMF61_16270 [Blastocatellia bacterium AA13]